MILYKKIMLAVFLFCLPHLCWARYEGKLIHTVTVVAPTHMDIPDIKRDLYALKGKPFSAHAINALIKTIYLSSRFHDVSVHADLSGKGKLSLSFILEAAKRIESIEFSGNREFSDIYLLRSVLSKKDGPFDEQTLLEDKFTLAALYEEIGFFNVRIQVRFFAPERSDTIHVVFDIAEHRPVKIRQFIIDSAGKPKAKHLKPLFTIEEGQTYRPSHLKEEILNLKKYFVENAYMEARFLPEEITFNADKSHVDIYLKVFPGPKYAFEFIGNHKLSASQLLTPLKEYDQTTPHVSEKDILRHIISAYKKQGYLNVDVSSRTFIDTKRNRKLISFTIRENAPVTIRNWVIVGNKHFHRAYYEGLIRQYGSALLVKNIYHPDDVEELSRLVLDHLKTKGFLLAKVSVGSSNWNSARTSAAPELVIEEGAQTIIKKIRVSGNRFFKDQEILDALDLPLNTPLNLHQLDMHLKNVIDLYHGRGFLQFKVLNIGTNKLISYASDFKSAALDLKCVEGPHVKIGDMIFRGAIRTHHRVLERELLISKGEDWNPEKIRQSEGRILRLGLFSSAKIVPLSGKFIDGENDLLIEVIERLPGLTELGGGYATDDGLRGYAGIAYRNFGGWNRVISARAAANRPLSNFNFLEKDFRLGFSEPYLGGIPFVARLNASHFKEGSLPFDEKAWKVKFSMDKWFWNFLHFDFQYAYEFRHIFRALNPRDIRRDIAASIGPALQFDFRDDSFNPTSGSYHAVSTFFYLPEIGSDDRVHLVRNLLTTSWYFSPARWLTIGLLGRAGYARSFSEKHDIPVDLRYYLGGRSTIRGFREDIIGATIKEEKIFENAFINYRTEFQLPLYGDFGLALFFDGGNVFFDEIAKPISVVNKFRHAFGPGLRYKTPIGPLSLDFGFILAREEGDPVGRFHFSIGRF